MFDDFNRADGAVYDADAGQWSTGGINSGSNALRVIGNALGVASDGNGRTADSFGPDVEIRATVTALPTNGSYVFLAARVHDEGTSNWDGYGLIVIRTGASSWVWALRRYDNGSSETLGSTVDNPALEVGGEIHWTLTADALEVAYTPPAGSPALVLSRTDATYAALGPAGIELGDSTVRLDNVTIASIVAETGEGAFDISAFPTVDFAGMKTASGSLDAAATPTATFAGIKTARGALSASATPTFETTGTKRALGQLAAMATPSFVASGIKAARGALSAVAHPVATFLGFAGADEPARLALSDRPRTSLVVADQPSTTLALSDRAKTSLTLEDGPAQ